MTTPKKPTAPPPPAPAKSPKEDDAVAVALAGMREIETKLLEAIALLTHNQEQHLERIKRLESFH